MALRKDAAHGRHPGDSFVEILLSGFLVGETELALYGSAGVCTTASPQLAFFGAGTPSTALVFGWRDRQWASDSFKVSGLCVGGICVGNCPAGLISLPGEGVCGALHVQKTILKTWTLQALHRVLFWPWDIP
jgi:hypothetical protein